MKCAAIVSFSVLLAATASTAQTSYGTASAQQPDQKQSPTTFVLQVPSACPVNMRALQGTDGQLQAVRNRQRSEPSGQHIHLILANTKPAQVVGAEIRVLGLSAKSHFARALSNQGGPFSLSRILHVTFTPENSNEVSADLVLPGFTSVTSIELKSMTYNDGSTWRVADHQTCHVTPDSFMQIAGR